VHYYQVLKDAMATWLSTAPTEDQNVSCATLPPTVQIVQDLARASVLRGPAFADNSVHALSFVHIDRSLTRQISRNNQVALRVFVKLWKWWMPMPEVVQQCP
jgi:hypothetical protein